MKLTGLVLLICLACLSATSSAYSPPPAPYQKQAYSAPSYQEPVHGHRPAQQSVYSRPPSKVHRPSKVVHGGASYGSASHGSVSHGSTSHGSVSHGAGYGPGIADVTQQVHRGAQASLGAALLDAQQALGSAQASIGAAHHDAHRAHQSAYDSIAAAHQSAHEAHASAYDSIAAAHSSVQAAHGSAQADLSAAHAEAQEALAGAQASVADAHSLAQEAHAEAQDSLAAAESDVRQAHAEAQAVIGELALYASQSKHASQSISYMLKKTLFTISHYFGPTKVRAPSMIVRDAATRGMVCVPRGSIDASEVVTGSEFSSAQRETHSTGQTVIAEAAGERVQVSGGGQYGAIAGDEVHKSVRPVQTIGQGRGIVVSVGSASAYGGRGATASAGPGGASAASGHVQTSSGHGASASVGGVSSSHEGTAASAESSSAAFGGASSTAGHAVSSPTLVSSSAGGVLGPAGPPVSSAHGAQVSSSSASHSSSAPGDGRYSATLSGGQLTVSGPGGSPQSHVTTTDSHGADSGYSQSHITTTGSHGAGSGYSQSHITTDSHGSGSGYSLTASSGGGSSAAASLDSDGRATLDVSGPHAEAGVSSGGSSVHLSGSSGLSAYLQPGDCECVPDYLCDEDGYINTSGAGVINIRSFSLGGGAEGGDARCGEGQVCCRRRGEREPVDWQPLRCGTRSPVRLDRRVVAGGAARLGEFPWAVALVPRSGLHGQTDGQQYLCGGSLIAPDVVLTGAHCVQGIHAGSLIARVGEWDTNNADPVYPHQDIPVARAVIHEQFEPKKLWYDVALLKLERPAQLGSHVNPVCLPDEDDYHIDYSDCFATGWGRESFDSAVYPNLLKKVPLMKVDSGQCQARMRETRLGRWFQLHETFLCAGGRPGLDTCRGDGGAALVCRDGPRGNEGEETFVQIGIVAWGINCHRGGFPGVYADVIQLLPWIRTNLATLAGDGAGSGY